MNHAEIVHYAGQMLWLVLILSLPTVVMAAAVGTLVSLVQALTQIQEQTLSFACKLVVVVVTLFATSGWLGHELYTFADMTLRKIPGIQ